ncbi:MAG: type IV toxin-antitoxin system AbiEi family antitoxin [bacterium]
MEYLTTGRRINEFLIPSFFFPKDNYYIGYSTMFNYYNFTDQQFQTIYVLNPTLCQEKIIAGLSFKFVKIPSKRMYGLERINIKGREVVISSKERTLIDLVYYNKPVGGIKVAIEILKKFVKEKKCNLKKLIEYAVMFPNIKTRKQIGLTLEKVGVPEAILRPLKKSVKDTSLISFSDSRKGAINEDWRVIINDSQR